MTPWACTLRWMPAGLAALMLFLGGTGCVQIPRKIALTPQVQADDLKAHVEFLTQPALHGRKCRTHEAGYVRQYIRRQFEAYGLEPWGRSRGYDLSFGFGVNVVGVMPGSDPELADEVVLVATHYDHLGMRDGQAMPGAAASAAAVASLLEVAERLTENGRPRRTVVFAAFDCGVERFFGAFAFTLRRDFDPDRIAAVVSLGMLGRHTFDVVPNTLIAGGTSRYPALRQAVDQAGRAAGIRVLPAGEDLLGPIGDHFAFQQWPVPAMHLTIGLYSDYYKASDMADKLDYPMLERITRTVVQTVRDLTDRPEIPAPQTLRLGDREELQAMETLLLEIRAEAARLSLTPGEIQMLEGLLERVRQLKAKDVYTLKDRSRLITHMVERAAPSVVRFLYDPPKPDPATLIDPQRMGSILLLQEFFAGHGPFASRALQDVVRHFIESRLNLFRLFGTYTFSSCDIRGDEVHYEQEESGRYRLAAIYPHLRIDASIAAREMDIRYNAIDITGEPGDIADFLLVTWSSRQDGCLDNVMPFLLYTISGQNVGGSYEEWLQWRLGGTGARDEAEWLRGPWHTRNPLLLKALASNAAASRRAPVSVPVLCQTILDRRMRLDVRAEAIKALPGTANRDCLLLLADMVADPTPAYPRGLLPAFDETFPFFEHITMQLVRRQPPPEDPTTLGDLALGKLQAATGEDLGKDPAAWREWIQEHR